MRPPITETSAVRDPALPKGGVVERSAAFADRVIRLSFALPAKPAGWEIARQIVRAAMSVGANIEEAQAAESKADFVHKMKIARKECRESRYFLDRILNATMIPEDRLRPLRQEAEEICSILTSIIKNTGG